MLSQRDHDELKAKEKDALSNLQEHHTACGQCARAASGSGILSRGCLPGRTLWVNWYRADRAYRQQTCRQPDAA